MTSVPGPERDYVGYGRARPVLRWPGEARLALNIAINVEEGSERSFHHGDGRNEPIGEFARAVEGGVRDLATESVFEYGSRVGVHRILRILDEFHVPATLFASAVALEANPPLAEAVAESEHDLCAHGHRWSEAWHVDREVERTEISLAYDSIRRTTGRAPAGWYNRWMASAHTRDLVAEHGGYRYDSNAYNDDLPYWTTAANRPHLVVPYTLTTNDSRYLSDGLSPAGFVDYCTRAIDLLAYEGHRTPSMITIGLHPRWSGQPARASALVEILEHVRDRGDIWVARRMEIAESFATQVTYSK